MEHQVFSPVVDAVKLWLDPQIAPAVYANGYNPGGARPQVSVTRVGGTDDACLLQVDVWGVYEPATEQLACQIEGLLDGMAPTVVGGTQLRGCSKPVMRFFPDEAQPRYILDVTVTATAVA